MYDDALLDALGAWQRGWREDKTRREEITRTLLDAIEETPGTLPVSDRLPLCYRKRFLVPNNPQNGGDFVTLILNGAIEEGVAAWTSDMRYHQQFKTMLRPGNVTALFAHQPEPDEVIVDFSALWADSLFVQAVDDYAGRGGASTHALLNFKDLQAEMILNAPLLSDEIVGFLGSVGDEAIIFEKAGALTEAEQDEVFRSLASIEAFPGQPYWLGKEGSRRAIARTREKWTPAWRRRAAAIVLRAIEPFLATLRQRGLLRGERS